MITMIYVLIDELNILQTAKSTAHCIICLFSCLYVSNRQRPSKLVYMVKMESTLPCACGAQTHVVFPVVRRCPLVPCRATGTLPPAGPLSASGDAPRAKFRSRCGGLRSTTTTRPNPQGPLQVQGKNNASATLYRICAFCLCPHHYCTPFC
jgi:hypothetical protein